ncbi:tripartite tricarboxylate transporter TctB [Bordetella avium]|uniref:tripartite tricarboxylate transporter TctB family protein n=1 Tax=Bordetella avium TaxID=521 RepID=UPI000FD8CC63|nr:tripartite tricarboxylate transporter TctB family protein [Bordetella avium]AZY48407.1 tripartite tricarboxylate transporter TctB [Bordetella avium]
MNLNNRIVVRGLFIMLIGIVFGGTALRYPIGTLGRFGPGLFPLIVSGLLVLIGITTIVRARFAAPETLDYNIKNIVIVLSALIAFVLVSHFINMLLGIACLVFISTLAGTSYSVVRNLKITVGLCAVAFGFKYFLGLSLPLL